MATTDNENGLDQQGQDQQDRTSTTVTTENNYQQWWFLAGGIAVLAIIAFILYSYVFTPTPVSKDKVPAPVVVDSTVTSDSTLQKQVDSLLSEFNNFKSKTSARLDSLEAPMWFRKLDQDASGGQK